MWSLVLGIEVRPRRALVALFKCEQTLARLERDIVTVIAGLRGLVDSELGNKR